MNNIEIRNELDRISEVLRASLDTTQTPVLINWEGERGDHSNKAAIYLEPSLLPAPPIYTGFQQTAKVFTGVYQITVVYPAFGGTLQGETIAQAIVDSDEWKKARPGGLVLQLTDAPYYGALLEDDDANRIPVTIPYSVCA